MATVDEQRDPVAEAVRERLSSMEAKMRKLSDQRRAHNDSARANADKRNAIQAQYNELKDVIKEILESQKEVRLRAKVHQARRDAIQEQLRGMFARSKEAKGNRKKSVVLQLSENRAEVERLENRLERDGNVSLDAEKGIHRRLKTLRSEIAVLEPQVEEEVRIKIDLDDMEGSIELLRVEADAEHKLMVEAHAEADKIWEEIKPKFDERDFLKAEGDRLHNLFVKHREEANSVHQQIQELADQVTEARNELQAMREERESWIVEHNKSVEESTSTPKDDEELAENLVHGLLGSGSLSLGGSTLSSNTVRATKKKRRRTQYKPTGPRRGGRAARENNE